MNPNQAAGALSWKVTGLDLTARSGNRQRFTVELVPEPGTTVLFLIAAAGFTMRHSFVA